jgi:ribosomal protein L13
MLYRNNLRENMLKKLHIFPGEKHFHEDKLPAESASVVN